MRKPWDEAEPIGEHQTYLQKNGLQVSFNWNKDEFQFEAEMK